MQHTVGVYIITPIYCLLSDELKVACRTPFFLTFSSQQYCEADQPQSVWLAQGPQVSLMA